MVLAWLKRAHGWHERPRRSNVGQDGLGDLPWREVRIHAEWDDVNALRLDAVGPSPVVLTRRPQPRQTCEDDSADSRRDRAG